MTEVRLFHGVDGVDRFVAQLLVARLLPLRQPVTVAVASEDAAHRLDDALWHQPDDASFIPHCVVGAEVEAETPVVITYPGAAPRTPRAILVSTAPELPSDARGHDQCVIVTSALLSSQPDLAAALVEMETQGHTVRRFVQSRRR